MSRKPVRLPFGHPKIFDTMKIEILRMENGESELSMPFVEEYTQHYGMLHGGAIFTLADAACGVAVASVAREGKKFLTSQMNINYLEPVSEGVTVCRARVLRQGRIMPVESEVLNSGICVAKASAVYTLVAATASWLEASLNELEECSTRAADEGLEEPSELGLTKAKKLLEAFSNRIMDRPDVYPMDEGAIAIDFRNPESGSGVLFLIEKDGSGALFHRTKNSKGRIRVNDAEDLFQEGRFLEFLT